MALEYNNSPKKDYHGKTIVFCLPGLMYSGTFMTGFIRLLIDLKESGMNFVISQKYSSMVNHARTDCLDADNYAGTMLTPFRGKINYDYIMWIDSDIVFRVEDFYDLLSMDKEVASGWYATADQNIGAPSQTTTVVEKIDDDRLLATGLNKYETIQDMAARPGPFKVDYCGFGWMLIKKGVFERVPYPWFSPQKITLRKEDGTILEDTESEDISMCREFKKHGIDIWVNPKVRVGHQKMLII